MLEIVLVEMKATHEVVGGLGKWAPRQKVSEKLGYPACCCGSFFYLQKRDLLLVCRQGGEVGHSENGGPWTCIPASVCRDSQRPESHPTFPQMQPH